MALSLPSLGLIYSLSLLVPGFITFKLAKQFSNITVSIDQLDKLLWVIIGSGASLSTVLITLQFIGTNRISPLLEFLDQPEISEFSLLAEIYVGTLFTAIIIGIATGYAVDLIFYAGENTRSESVWQLTYLHREEPARVHAVMDNGDEIWGEIYVSDSQPHGKDLLLKWPQKLMRDDHGNIDERINLGKYVYLNEDGISHVYYETEIDV